MNHIARKLGIMKSALFNGIALDQQILALDMAQAPKLLQEHAIALGGQWRWAGNRDAVDLGATLRPRGERPRDNGAAE